MIEVVAGIIYKKEKLLIAKRNLKKNQGGLWEFPGGKVEKGETYEEALKREIKEELNADIQVEEFVCEKIHHYPEKDIKLIFLKAKILSEKIQLNEHEDAKWVDKTELEKFDFAPADMAVAKMLKEN